MFFGVVNVSYSTPSNTLNAIECLLQLLLSQQTELHWSFLWFSGLSPEFQFEFFHLLTEQTSLASLLLLGSSQAGVFGSQ